MNAMQEIIKTKMQIAMNRALYNQKAISAEQYRHADASLQLRLTQLNGNDKIRYSEVM